MRIVWGADGVLSSLADGDKPRWRKKWRLLRFPGTSSLENLQNTTCPNLSDESWAPQVGPTCLSQRFRGSLSELGQVG